VGGLETQFRSSYDATAADRLVASLQRQSALDLVLLPISQSDEYLYAKAGVEVDALSFGPGWQLGLWGIGGG
jgi:peptide/nickel transport system substrate-binding protein